jgi:diguanylate cyclase (GGDEF)-like protein/PAS domain S-box-containing protein
LTAIKATPGTSGQDEAATLRVMDTVSGKLSLPRSSRLWRGLPELIAVVGLALSALLYFQSQANLRERQLAFFESEVRKSVAMVQARMDNYHHLLRAAAGIFMTQTSPVSRQQFRHYLELQGLYDELSGVQGVGYATAIRPAELAAHTRAMQQQGFPDYQVQPAGERPLYTSIIYLEPFLGRNLRAFGYDMYSEPVRRQAMQRAADTGGPALSGKVRLKQEDGRDEQAGFLLYLPVYRQLHIPDSVDERRLQLNGWVYAAFRMNDFMQGLLGEHTGDLLLDIYDGPQPLPEQLMHTEQPLASGGYASVPSTFVSVQRLRMMGHTWTLSVRPSPLALSRLDSSLPMFLGLGAALLSLMLGALVWVLVSGRERAIQTALAMNEELIRERARLTAILDGTHAGTWEWNVQTGETVFNTEWARMVGYELQELEPLNIDTWSRLAHPDDLARAQERLQQHFSGVLPYYECEMRMRHKDGHWVWVQARGKVWSRSADGRPLMMYGTHQDITPRKEKEQAYKHGAQHDPLTDLPNRALLADRLERALLAARRDGSHVALLFMDLDGFKLVNDSYGHDAGDLVLCTMAQRIQTCIRASDTLARIGGDEFVVLLPDVGDVQNAVALAHKIGTEARRPIKLNEDGEARLSVSVGVALYPEHGEDAGALTEHADQAMYKAKRGGKNAVVVYEAGWPPAETSPSS